VIVVASCSLDDPFRAVGPAGLRELRALRGSVWKPSL